MIIPTPDATAPFFDVADPAFSVTSAEVRRAREAGWYARTSYGLAAPNLLHRRPAGPVFTEMNGSDAEGHSGCSCHLCRLLACCRTRRRHLGM